MHILDLPPDETEEARKQRHAAWFRALTPEAQAEYRRRVTKVNHAFHNIANASAALAEVLNTDEA